MGRVFPVLKSQQPLKLNVSHPSPIEDVIVRIGQGIRFEQQFLGQDRDAHSTGRGACHHIDNDFI
ncbi:MAG TPA: hypothetical protein VNJ12_00415, partial [Candidatus Dormibacteraeota bacterium]|nr:hypothetical protein [Candidatus Dormibacteraeota bacterium]